MDAITKLLKTIRYTALENGNYRIRVRDFYPKNVSEEEYTEVNYDTLIYLAKCKRKKKAQEMEDYRRLTKFSFDEVKLAEMEGIFIPSAEDQNMDKITSEALRNALLALDEKSRRKFYLRHVVGLKVNQIADMEGFSPQAVGQNIEVTKKRLQKYMCNNDSWQD